MTRRKSRPAQSSARLIRRRGAAWAVTAVALVAAAIAFWRIAPSEQRGQALAVNVPAASTPAAAEGPVPS